jgi:hypothetical protein
MIRAAIIAAALLALAACVPPETGPASTGCAAVYGGTCPQGAGR